METNKTKDESPFGRNEVQSYITYLQDIIDRMASNSSMCKNWLITIVVALIALGVSNRKMMGNVWICTFPTIIFMLLDAYYLGLERHYRRIQKTFVVSVKKDTFEDKLYDFSSNIRHNSFCNTFRALGSFSIWFFYGIILVGIVLIELYVTYCIETT